MTGLEKQIQTLARRTQKAARRLALCSTEEKNAGLKAMAEALNTHRDKILKANEKDMKAGRKNQLSSALLDRLWLNEKRIQGMSDSLEATRALKDPVGEVMETFRRPNGLLIQKVRVPLGVVGIIYESRPNVTSDCLGLCLKSGNGVILKGGKEALASNQAIFRVCRKALEEAGLPAEAAALIASVDRQAVKILLRQEAWVDLIVPRGGEGLIRFVAENSLIPVVKHYKGVCHTFVSDQADLNMAHAVCLNAKLQRPGVCNAMETLLVQREAAFRLLPGLIQEFVEQGVEIRGCPLTRRIVKTRVKRATAQDWSEEYLDKILSVKVVETLDEAMDHINTYGSHHSDAIITEDPREAEMFFRAVDSACVYHNASTRFTDGYEFGFGAEVGISTDKIHARGPMALEGLTTYKYCVEGTGQIKE